jgi:hypothetical protein
MLFDRSPVPLPALDQHVHRRYWWGRKNKEEEREKEERGRRGKKKRKGKGKRKKEENIGEKKK